MSRRGVALAALLTVVILAGCESTEQESAKIGKQLGSGSAAAAVTTIKSSNHAVRVDRSVLVHSASGTAAAIELTSTSATPQVDIPIVITVDDAAGKAVYTNDTVGTTSPEGELSLLEPGATVWWVDANVIASGGSATSVTATIGAPAASAPASLPTLAARHLGAGSNFVGPYIGGTVSNGSATAQSQVAIYAVALEGREVVAAGQSLVPAVAAHGSMAFQVTVFGTTKGATPFVSVAPARLP
jgi:hypothetical protein